MTSWSLKWRAKVIEAVEEDDAAALTLLSSAALKNLPSAADLEHSGVGLLLNDASVWDICDEQTKSNIQMAKQRWKDHTKSERRTCKPVHPLGPLRARGYKESAAHFREWLALLDGAYASEEFAKLAARCFAFHGFENCRQLEGLSLVDIGGWSKVAGVQAFLSRAITAANTRGAAMSVRSEANKATSVDTGEMLEVFAGAIDGSRQIAL